MKKRTSNVVLPAEKTHYRKGLALGMTLAETFSVVVFILLMACAVLLLALRDELGDTQADLAITENILLDGDTTRTNTDAWYDAYRRKAKELEAAEARAEEAERSLVGMQARAEEAEVLLSGTDGVDSGAVTSRLMEQAVQLASVRDSLRRADQQMERQEARRDSVEVRMADAERIAESLRAQVALHQSITPAEADSIVERAARAEQLSQELEEARQAVRDIDARRREADRMAAGSPADSLRARLDRSEQARADAVGRAEYREDEIRRLTEGRGVDPPPCWMTEERSPEYIFRVELTDRGMRLHDIVPDEHADDEVALYAAQAIEYGREYIPDEFLRLTEPIHSMGRGRTDAFGPGGCRFWVDPVDRTGESKAVFRERTSQLWRRFWFRWSGSG